jgi:hypothetical protein
LPYTVDDTVDDALVVTVDAAVVVAVEATDVVFELVAVDDNVDDGEVRRHFERLLNSPAVKSSRRSFNAPAIDVHSSRVAAPLVVVAYQFPYESQATLSVIRLEGSGPVFSSTRSDSCWLTWAQPVAYIPKSRFRPTSAHCSGYTSAVTFEVQSVRRFAMTLSCGAQSDPFVMTMYARWFEVSH